MHAPVNPVTDELEQMVREAAAGEGRDAALTLADAREMARDDEFCAAALDRVRSEVPDDVWRWSKTVWSGEKRNAVFFGAAAAGVGLLAGIFGLAFSVWALFFIALLIGLTGGIVIWYGLTKLR